MILDKLRSSIRRRSVNGRRRKGSVSLSPSRLSQFRFDEAIIIESDDDLSLDLIGDRIEAPSSPCSSLSSSSGRSAMAEREDPCEETRSCSTVFDGAFKLNAALREQATRAVDDEIAAESLCFAKMQQSIDWSIARATLCDEGKTEAGVKLHLKNACSATEELFRCIITFRKLHEYKASMKKSSFTPGQYKMITRKVNARAADYQDNEVDKSDALLCTLSRFSSAVRADASRSEQLGYAQELVAHIEHLTVDEVLSPKKAKSEGARKGRKPAAPCAADRTVATIQSSFLSSSSLASLSIGAWSCSSPSSPLPRVRSLQSLGPPPLVTTPHLETRQDYSQAELVCGNGGFATVQKSPTDLLRHLGGS
jgi:hypothetical protein